MKVADVLSLKLDTFLCQTPVCYRLIIVKSECHVENKQTLSNPNLES